MNAKKLYRIIIHICESIPAGVTRWKTYLGERCAIHRKKHLYVNIKWSREEKKQFEEYWKRIYGKKISPKWHKLYQAVSGEYCVNYVPEILYTTKLEPNMVDYMYGRVLANKGLVEFLCADPDVKFPATILVRDAGSFYDASRECLSMEDAIGCISCSGVDMVMKPTIGSSSGRSMIFAGSGLSREEIAVMMDGLGDDFIVQEQIKQSEELALLNESSVNTIRIITYLAKDSVHHAPVTLRIGRRNKRVDNIHAGGICVSLTDEGELNETGYELGYGDMIKRYREHPDSGISFQGRKIAQVGRIIEAASRLHGRFPHTSVISWDFTVNHRNEVVLIEVNTQGQGIWFPQMISGKGLFADDLPGVLHTYIK